LGVVKIEKLREWRSYFIVGAFVVAAIVTPPDVISQLALAVPMCLLYELGILAASLVSKGTTRAEVDAAAVDAAQASKNEAAMRTDLDAELDKAEAEFRKLDGK
jgi:sec-independent protein translocase protein TatC